MVPFGSAIVLCVYCVPAKHAPVSARLFKNPIRRISHTRIKLPKRRQYLQHIAAPEFNAFSKDFVTGDHQRPRRMLRPHSISQIAQARNVRPKEIRIEPVKARGHVFKCIGSPRQNIITAPGRLLRNGAKLREFFG